MNHINSTKAYKAEQKKKALGMLKALTERIKRNELEVETNGWWPGTAGSFTFKVVAKESEDSKLSTPFS